MRVDWPLRQTSHARRVAILNGWKAMLEICHSTAARLTWIFCQQGLQFFSDKSAALAEMNRVLVTNGKLILGVWRSKEHQPGVNAMADALERHIGAEAGAIRRAPFAFGDAGAIRSLMTGAGFRNVEGRPTVKIGSLSFGRVLHKTIYLRGPL